ncbi:hypothetical protein SPHINGO391_490122 [Sphingomonas aurantiaca]|uniref:Uncharacterized protein n=1 Tax=Sphingomonas aurantiaca TaxID=185949 RepID=A0A5E8A4G5_9SPHN|nr:hypothetical protein SPHINGO391_490122 [Sphingomonas aurantiaca]
MQGGDPADEAGRVDHQHGVGQLGRSGRGTARLRHHQGRDPDLHQGARQAARQEGHPRQHDRAGPSLDAAAGRGRSAARQDGRVRPGHAAWPRGPTRRTRVAVRDAGGDGHELHQRQRLRRDRRQRRAVSKRTVTILPRQGEVAPKVTEGEDAEQTLSRPPPPSGKRQPPPPGGGGSKTAKAHSTL